MFFNQETIIHEQSTKVLIYESIKQSMNQSYNYRIYYGINASNISKNFYILWECPQHSWVFLGDFVRRPPAHSHTQSAAMVNMESDLKNETSSLFLLQGVRMAGGGNWMSSKKNSVMLLLDPPPRLKICLVTGNWIGHAQHSQCVSIPTNVTFVTISLIFTFLLN